MLSTISRRVMGPVMDSLDPPLLLLSNKVDILMLHTTNASEQQVGFNESEEEPKIEKPNKR